MCDITRTSFETQFTRIIDALKLASFIALDTEFTGILASEKTKGSLFDSSEERYKKLMLTVSQITICQIGLSAFVKIPSTNRYEAHTFNFHLFPRSFGSFDIRFLCQVSSLEFLCNHNFDFNKFIYDGVSFMNSEQEKTALDQIANHDLFEGLEREVDEMVVQAHCSHVAEWLVDVKAVDKLVIPIEKDLSDYVLHTEIRKRFKDVWTATGSFGEVVVEKVRPEEREKLEQDSKQSHEIRLLNDLLGFTRVFRELISLKKPLLGHNVLTDLMLIYDKFHQSLPEKYTEFKANLHQLFPVIYDTKHIANKSRREYKDTELLDHTGLGQLYQMMDSDKGKYHVLCSPDIKHAVGFERYVGSHLPHEAGYDAYMCGYVFLRLSHMIKFQNISSSDVTGCDFKSYLHALDPFKNRVNIIRANINNVLFGGNDPPSLRPEMLFVRSRGSKKQLHPNQYVDEIVESYLQWPTTRESQGQMHPFKNDYTGASLARLKLASWFSPYGSVDIKMQGRNKALLATGNFGCAKDILREFRRHSDISITKYSIWKHSPVVRRLLWTGTLVSGGICAWVIFGSKRQH